jgi:hypothetical protein
MSVMRLRENVISDISLQDEGTNKVLVGKISATDNKGKNLSLDFTLKLEYTGEPSLFYEAETALNKFLSRLTTEYEES